MPAWQVIDAGFNWEKLIVEVSNMQHVDLRQVLREGSYLVDGILNQEWKKGKTWYINGAVGEQGPAGNEKAWRHAIAVKDGRVYESTEEGVDYFSMKWLWLSDDGVTPLQNGYMRRILKVYKVTRRQSTPAEHQSVKRNGDDGGDELSSSSKRARGGSDANSFDATALTLLPLGLTTTVCIKVPPPRERIPRAEYEACEGREEWLQHVLGSNGVYVARPKNDGGWHASPTVKAGSMFANPFPVGVGEGKFSDDESMHQFQQYVMARSSPEATTAQVIKLLPPAMQKLAERRHADGAVKESEGKSVAHLHLEIVGAAFLNMLHELQGKRLGCWCGPGDKCHARILARLVEPARLMEPAPKYSEYPNEAWTITWGDVAMNEVKMQRIGQALERGASVSHLQDIMVQLEANGMPCELVDLRQLLPECQRESASDAAVLVVRNGVKSLSEDPEGEAKLLAEQRSMPIDKKAWDARHGGVFNKQNRYNNLLGDEDQAADYANRKGCVVDSSKYPITSKLRTTFTTLLGVSNPLVGETNHYFNASECGIGWHGAVASASCVVIARASVPL